VLRPLLPRWDGPPRTLGHAGVPGHGERPSDGPGEVGIDALGDRRPIGHFRDGMGRNWDVSMPAPTWLEPRKAKFGRQASGLLQGNGLAGPFNWQSLHR